MFYLLYSLIFFGLGYFIVVHNSVKKNYLYFFYFAIVLFWGLSYIYAADTDGYMEKFEYDIRPISLIKKIRIDQQFEFGYSLLATICKTVTSGYWFFQVFVFGSEIFLIIQSIKYFYRGKEWLYIIPLLFFMYPSMLGVFRQGIAVAIFIYAIQFIFAEKKPWRYFIYILIATLFHKSAIVLVLVYLARYLKRYLSYDWLMFSILILCNLLYVLGFSLVNQMDSLMLLFQDTSDTIEVVDKYAHYVEDFTGKMRYGVFKLLEIDVGFVLYTLYCKKDQDYLLMRFLLLLFIIISMAISGFIAHRLNYYFSILYYFCFIRGVVSAFRMRKIHVDIPYLIIAVYMIWFFVFKNNYIEFEYRFLLFE